MLGAGGAQSRAQNLATGRGSLRVRGLLGRSLAPRARLRSQFMATNLQCAVRGVENMGQVPSTQ